VDEGNGKEKECDTRFGNDNGRRDQDFDINV
jgi:hypothetical protein